MSELIQKHDNRATIRWKLLTGASALALTAYVSSASIVKAEDSSQPQIWIELGGELGRLQAGRETFAPEFPNSPSRPPYFDPSQKFEKPPLFGIDEDGKISFQPENFDWVFSAAIQYGRAVSKKHAHQEIYVPRTYVTHAPLNQTHITVYLTGIAQKFADTRVRNTESHSILDFQAGKDVGLGLFGKDGSSVVSAGVRIAQFRSNSNIAVKSNPDWHLKYFYSSSPVPHSVVTGGEIYHSNAASLRATRSFRGIGPSLSWNASAPFAGNGQNGELTLDWGVDVAFLFGKQKTRTHHQTTGRYHGPKYPPGYRLITYQGPAHPDHTRSRNVTVPNLGGFAGISWNYADAKLSLGYRADFFFNAIDGGIDARKNEDRSFFGPYASISVGLGD